MNDKKNKASEKDRKRAHKARRVSSQCCKYAATLCSVTYLGQYPTLQLLEEPKSF